MTESGPRGERVLELMSSPEMRAASPANRLLSGERTPKSPKSPPDVSMQDEVSASVKMLALSQVNGAIAAIGSTPKAAEPNVAAARDGSSVNQRGRRGFVRIWPSEMQTLASCARKSERSRNCTG